MNSGVYMLVNEVTYDYYIGSSKNWVARHCRRRSQLRRNAKENPHLQYAWNKYGEGAFTMYPLEYVDREEDLRKVEFDWIEILAPAYNTARRDERGRIMPSPEGRNKIRLTHLGRKRSPETCQRISLANRGKIVSAESRRRVSESQRKRFSLPGSTDYLKIKTVAHCASISRAKKGKPCFPNRVLTEKSHVGFVNSGLKVWSNKTVDERKEIMAYVRSHKGPEFVRSQELKERISASVKRAYEEGRLQRCGHAIGCPHRKGGD